MELLNAIFDYLLVSLIVLAAVAWLVWQYVRRWRKNRCKCGCGDEPAPKRANLSVNGRRVR